MDRPEKPYPEFPLFAHKTGQWAKKIQGKTYYFGVWADPLAARDRYLDEVNRIRAGRERFGVEGVDVAEACNSFLIAKRTLVSSGELSERTWREYRMCCARITQAFGRKTKLNELVPADFDKLRESLAKTRGPVTLTNEVQRVKTLFRYAYEVGLIDKPIRTGPTFKRASQLLMRRAKNERAKKLFTRDELQTLISQATGSLKCWILLGINCAYGPGDISALPVSAIHTRPAVIRFPRPKTAIPRECPLWPETVAALRSAIRNHVPSSKPELAPLLFRTRKDCPLVHFHPKSGGVTDSVGTRFLKLRKACGITRDGTNFYALRHTFQTIADAVKDPVAVRLIMGHVAPAGDMSDEYREEIDPERLVMVTDHVHKWLFG